MIKPNIREKSKENNWHQIMELLQEYNNNSNNNNRIIYKIKIILFGNGTILTTAKIYGIIIFKHNIMILRDNSNNFKKTKKIQSEKLYLMVKLIE
jgi:hypothetical protein